MGSLKDKRKAEGDIEELEEDDSAVMRILHRGVGYHFTAYREGNGFWAECIELPGCFTQGESEDELIENMRDALATYFE